MLQCNITEWASHITRMRQKWIHFGGEARRKETARKTRWENTSKLCTENWMGLVYWIHLTQDMDQ
jgi:hypothetical protein